MTSDPLIANTGFDKAKGMDLLRSGDADAIAYGSLYIANPDLVARFKADAPLSKPYPPLSVARVQRATPTLRRYRPKTRLRRPTQVGSPRASCRMSCPGARRGRGARR
jgi:hypothetical protein